MLRVKLEKELYPVLRTHLRKAGYSVYLQVRPRPRSPRTFDVVGIHPRRKSVVIIEAKLDHFRRAFDQALLRLHVADRVYLSFPCEYALKAFQREEPRIRSAGLGLLAVQSRQVVELISPRKSTL